MRVLTCALAAGVITFLAMGQSRPTSAPAESSQKSKANAKPARDVKQILNGRVPEVNFEEAPLEEVMEWVEKYTGAMVYVRWPVLEEVGIERDTPITVKARDRKLSLILWVILNEAKGASGVTLAYEASAELFLFSTHEDLSGEMVVRVYDVRDIAVDVPEFVGRERRVPRTRVRRTAPPPRQCPQGEVTPGEQAPRAEVTTEDEKLQEFMELILVTIEPESWQINGLGGKGMIFPYKGKLVVRNSRRVHQLIGSGRKP